MGDLGSTLSSINQHLDSFSQLGLTPAAAKLLSEDNQQLSAHQETLNQQTRALANEVMTKLNNLKIANFNQQARPSASAQSQVADHLDKERKLMKERIEDLLKRPPGPQKAVEKTYKPKT